jgi:hypothetical protein
MRALVSGDGLNVFRAVLKSAAAVIVTLFGAAAAQAQAPGEAPGGEANLIFWEWTATNFCYSGSCSASLDWYSAW